MTEPTGSESTETPSHGPRYVIGIDLGTTNTAVAYVDLHEDEDATRRPIRLFDVTQLIAPGEVAARQVLPSFLYLPGAYDLPAGAAALPWDADRDYIVGELAREQGARVPGRLVASAKSWLSHSRVDRSAPILPWGADDDVPQVSPVEAASRYLQHIREAWDTRMAPAESDDDAVRADALRFDAQQIVLTVPASFDEVARELTLEAAREAGMANAVLLEEPLAAFYAWLARHEVDWQQRMRDGQIILVCDVGGGTTDFTLVGIRAGASGLRFDRLAVGEHLMLGGDNMDYTLGRTLEARLFERPGALDAQRWHQLVFECRSAKERLLDDEQAPDKVEVTVTGTGSALIGGTRSGTLTKEEVQRLILDGFFPPAALGDVPEEGRRGGLTELGLPYEQEPAIPRHLAAFWNRFEDLLRRESGRDDVYPDFVLFNGGALTPAAIRRRLLTQLASWFDVLAGEGWEPEELHNPHPELAVARGAAYYGLVRQGLGVRVGSGSPRTYYVGVGTGSGETDGYQTAVCLVPRGTEEGFAAQLDALDFEARTNQPVAFRILASSTRTEDAFGQVVELPADEVTELPSIRTVLRYGRSGEARALPVTLGVQLTEVGTLAVYCASRQTDHRWQLQFDVRQSAAAGEEGQGVEETLDQGAVEAAQAVIRDTFATDAPGDPLPAASIRRNLEEVLARPKEHWPTPLIRALADALLETAPGRTQSPEHEARWLNTLGFCLRPGYGDPLDEWRMKRTWKLFFEGPAYPRQGNARSEWWIFWRRVGGGLNAGQQNEVFQLVRPYLQPSQQRKTPRLGLPKHISGGELLEVWMMLGNLERLPADVKGQLGDALLPSIGQGPPRARELWSLSRIGARSPVYGPVDRTLPGGKAAQWLDRLMAMELEPSDATAQALVLMARSTGDRVRDIPTPQQESVAGWLASLPHGERWIQLLRDPSSSLRHEEEEWIFGESLPSGLVLSHAAAE